MYNYVTFDMKPLCTFPTDWVYTFLRISQTAVVSLYIINRFLQSRQFVLCEVGTQLLNRVDKYVLVLEGLKKLAVGCQKRDM